MLTHPTTDRLRELGLAGMARAFGELQDNPSAADLGHAEWLALLLDREATAQERLGGSTDHAAAVEAFLAKQKPVFVGH